MTSDEPKDFGHALLELFTALDKEWLDAAFKLGQVTDERVLRELTLPEDARTALCYLVLPRDLIGTYRELVFPLIEEADLVPATGHEIIEAGGNRRAMNEALLRRATAVIIDIGTGASTESQEADLIRRERPTTPLLIVRELVDGSEDDRAVDGARVIVRPQARTVESPAPHEPPWLGEIQAWIMGTRHTGGVFEATRLMALGELRAAIVSAIGELEITLRHALLESPGGQPPTPTASSRGILGLLRSAGERQLITPEVQRTLIEAVHARNLVAHGADAPPEPSLRELTTQVLAVLQQLRPRAPRARRPRKRPPATKGGPG